MKLFNKLLCLFLLLIGSADLAAGPTIIRDNRVTDLATTPVLGRGYSIGTNTFQSTCMEKVVITEPSYDMKYSFIQLDDRSTERSAVSDQQTQESSRSQRQSRSTSNTTASRGLFSFNVSGNYSSTQSGIDQSLRSVSKSTVIAGKTYYSHSMLVTINLYSYYASLDESQSRLSPSALTLLEGKDLPGFFSSCGPYYVRSIGRHATFVSIFTYQSESETRDESFEDQLRTEVSRFSTESKTSFSAKAGMLSFLSAGVKVSTDKTTQSDRSREMEEQQRRQEFNSKAESYRLTINTSAYGLGKDKRATLISFDMDTYKAAVKDAFMAMQNPLTGKVSSIEVVPWVENTEFQAHIKLEEEEIPVDSSAAEGEGPPPRKKLLYEKKHILNQNAEFFMEIERAGRNKMNMYYKGRLCKKNMDVNFKQGNALKPEYADVLLINHRGGASITLETLNQAVTDQYVKDLLQQQIEFMYGTEGDEGSTGASECIRQIMTEGIYQKSYRQISECQPILEQLGDAQPDLLENFCMPEIASF